MGGFGSWVSPQCSSMARSMNLNPHSSPNPSDLDYVKWACGVTDDDTIREAFVKIAKELLTLRIAAGKT